MTIFTAIILLRDHEAEAERHGAEFTNFGWCTDEHKIESKTNKAILVSTISLTTLAVRHKWLRRAPRIFSKLT
jgi:hypothetical protein